MQTKPLRYFRLLVGCCLLSAAFCWTACGRSPEPALGEVEEDSSLSPSLSSPDLIPLSLATGPILILDIDTLRADHLGCYGYSRPTSPNIDALARESFRFEWAFSQAPFTPPSQSSILTGLYPSTHGMIENYHRLPDSVTTIAEAFAAEGYRTAAFVDGGYMVPDFGLDQGFEEFEVFRRKGLEAIGPRAMDWLQDHADEKFLLLLHTYDVHSPYDPPEPYRSLFTSGMVPTPGFEPDPATLRKIRTSRWTDKPLSLSLADLAFSKARYDGGIRFVDDWIGRILDHVRALGLDRRLTIVLISDHGEEFQEHGTVEHDRLYTTVTRIPLVIRPPGGVQGTVIPSVVQAVDLMPTLLEWSGITPPSDIQGRSLLPLMRGLPRRQLPAFSESPWFGQQRSIVFGEHHLIGALNNEKVELFSFRRDPLELEELSAEDPETVAYLTGIWERWLRSVERQGKPVESEPAQMDEDTVRSLKALGYL